MKIISHRGNLNGRTLKENHPEYIRTALEKGFDVEVDVRFINNIWYLGHDDPEYEVNFKFLQTSNLWVHAKTIQTAAKLFNTGLHYFYHNNDFITLTSCNYLWTYPGQELTPYSICVLIKYPTRLVEGCFGVCTDFPERYYELIN